MPLVFVHGVSNRAGEAYDRSRRIRESLFREFLLAPDSGSADSNVEIVDAFWGDLGGRLRWDGRSMPIGDFEALGSEVSDSLTLYAATGVSPSSRGRAILEVAEQRTLLDAVDLVWPAASVVSDAQSEELAALAPAVVSYARANEHPDWISDVRDDREFVTALAAAVQAAETSSRDQARSSDANVAGATDDLEFESLGGVGAAWDALRSAVSRVGKAVVGTVGESVSDHVRPAVMPSVSAFLGDILAYLDQRHDTPAATDRSIAGVVGGHLRAAASDRSDDDPLVVVAHSMGGNITYDLLTSDLSDVDVDVFVTVGSQVALFEELKLFSSSDDDVPGMDLSRLVSPPSNVGRWVNIFDQSDLLGFAVGRVIDGVEDYSFRTGSLFKAHSAYFSQPGFHERLAARINGGGS
ncbi:MAG TPA: hypothetical protein VJ978_08420 [Nitriliruptoraceae bacterium]|nr:hypothetical protein [Nitriliruptoraceae bacterium]